MKKAFLLFFIFLAITISLKGDSLKGVVVSSDATPILVHPSGTGEVQMLLASDQTGDQGIYLGRARFLPAAEVSRHVHENSIEMIYMISGTGEFNLEGTKYPVKAGDAIYIPKNAPHSFKNTGGEVVEVVQIYSPCGPEERFRSWKKQQED